MSEYSKLVFAAVNSCKAGRVEILCAKLFGKKTTEEDSGYKVTVYSWLGKSYVTAFIRISAL